MRPARAPGLLRVGRGVGPRAAETRGRRRSGPYGGVAAARRAAPAGAGQGGRAGVRCRGAGAASTGWAAGARRVPGALG